MTLARFQKLKRGQKVKLSKEYIKFYNEEAFHLCTARGVIPDEEGAIDFMVRKMIGLGFKHEVTYIGKERAATPQVTGYFRIYVGNKLGFEVYLDYGDVI